MTFPKIILNVNSVLGGTSGVVCQGWRISGYGPLDYSMQALMTSQYAGDTNPDKERDDGMKQDGWMDRYSRRRSAPAAG